jgi:uncharacterized protein YndB with AHSA1/START domain
MCGMATLEMDRKKVDGSESGAPMLELTRVIRASRARVYEAWTRPEILKHWHAPGEMNFVSAVMDVREGGTYEVLTRGVMCSTEGTTEEDRNRRVTVRGEYRRVIPNELLQFTWSGSWAPMEISMVTVSLRDVEGGTEITLRHEQFATESSRDGHVLGWDSLFGKLATALEG